MPDQNIPRLSLTLITLISIAVLLLGARIFIGFLPCGGGGPAAASANSQICFGRSERTDRYYQH